MHGYIAVKTSFDVPDYVLKEPLRQFFIASILASLLAGTLGFVPLRRLCEKRPTFLRFLMSVGASMTLIGSIGMFIILPFWGKLSEPGGLTPDLGHTLTYDNSTGALWLFLLTGFIPYGIGYVANPKPRPALSTGILVIVLGVPIYFTGYSLYLYFRLITAP